MNIFTSILTSSVMRTFVLRHIGSAITAYLVTKQITTNEGAAQLTAALMTIWSVIHSAWDKRAEIKADIQGLLK